MQRVVFVLAALALTACGGGGSGGGVATTAQPGDAQLSSDAAAELDEFRALAGGETLRVRPESLVV